MYNAHLQVYFYDNSYKIPLDAIAENSRLVTPWCVAVDPHGAHRELKCTLHGESFQVTALAPPAADWTMQPAVPARGIAAVELCVDGKTTYSSTEYCLPTVQGYPPQRELVSQSDLGPPSSESLAVIAQFPKNIYLRIHHSPAIDVCVTLERADDLWWSVQKSDVTGNLYVYTVCHTFALAVR